MNLFRKRDKQKNGSGLTDQQYSSSPHDPNFAPTDVAGNGSGGNGSRSLRSRNFKSLKGFSNLGSGKDEIRDVAGPGDYNNTSRRRRNIGESPAAWPATSASARALQKLPDTALARIFTFVCPHSQDRTYEKCEDTSLGDGCMLCDMRDLAHCVQVCRKWRLVAQPVLYTSIRIDPVHFCAREAFLADKRKRRSFFDRNGEPEDTPDARLKLLCRTLRSDQAERLGEYVQFLKIPYMLRESRHADIARTISVLPNLRYVDLPEGLFMDEQIYVTLRMEIQAKCPDLRKMTYMNGAERSLEALASGTLWRNLEVLDLIKIGMDPAMMRHVLSSLPNLRGLKVTEAATGPHAFSDEVLATSSSSHSFPVGQHLAGMGNESFSNTPPLEELVLTDTRRLTSDGLIDYLNRPDAGRTLKVLTINGTGVKPWSLQTILRLATSLRHLTIVDEVSVALPIAAGTKDIQPLASRSLQTLNYEIRPSKGVSPYAGVTRSYYNYLSGSILSGGLSNLRAVYVRDATFPESLLSALPLPPPGPINSAAFGEVGGGSHRPMSSKSAAATASALSSPMSTSSFGQVQSPMGFLSPHQSPGFPQAPPFAQQSHSHRVSSSSQNPFLDPFSPTSQRSFQSSSPPVSLAPPSKPWATGHNPRFSSNNPFAGMISPQQVQTLEVFTKGDDDIDWSSFLVGGDLPFGGGGSGSRSRPVSGYGIGTDLGSAGARKSVLISTGAGNFLAVPDSAGGGIGGSSGRRGSHSSGNGPDLWPRPMSSAGEKKSEKRDLWR